jgi:hypothetical protein
VGKHARCHQPNDAFGRYFLLIGPVLSFLVSFIVIRKSHPEEDAVVQIKQSVVPTIIGLGQMTRRADKKGPERRLDKRDRPGLTASRSLRNRVVQFVSDFAERVLYFESDIIHSGNSGKRN